MYPRLLHPLKTKSFFLFGARGTGKTSLLRKSLSDAALWIDLLSDRDFITYSHSPDTLFQQARAIVQTVAEAKGVKAQEISWIVIDEVQRIPKLLNEVHRILEDPEIGKRVLFCLTGSSARKLKRGGANLLAGRALTNNLFPLTFVELDKDFDLDTVLNWGSLPLVITESDDNTRIETLESYYTTYLREEIKEEQVVRNLDPFTRFLEVAAQASGEIVNYSSVAADCRVEPKAVARYFQILEDTLLGFFLPSYHRSIRKQQTQSPRFYFFDFGVRRVIQGAIGARLIPQSSEYGKAFEHFVILEIMRLNSYLRTRYKLYYLRTKDDAEVDLIIERAGAATILMEIKSTTTVDAKHLRHLESFLPEFQNAEAWIVSRDVKDRIQGNVKIKYWENALRQLFCLEH